jgi:hypothetical protein
LYFSGTDPKCQSLLDAREQFVEVNRFGEIIHRAIRMAAGIARL